MSITIDLITITMKIRNNDINIMIARLNNFVCEATKIIERKLYLMPNNFFKYNFFENFLQEFIRKYSNLYIAESK